MLQCSEAIAQLGLSNKMAKWLSNASSTHIQYVDYINMNHHDGSKTKHTELSCCAIN